MLLPLLALGVYFRFANLGRRVTRFDEAHTGLWISGRSSADLALLYRQRGVVPIEDLGPYKHTHAGTRAATIARAMARTEPHQTLLYPLLAWQWGRHVGDSMAALRALSATVSVLAFPLIFWLSWELFDDRRVAAMAVALLAVSPIHVLYAQEARAYSLWTVAILLACATLLWALRRQTRLSWGLYAASLALALYTHLLSALVALGHGIYVVDRSGWRLTRSVRAYVWASLLGGVLFLPWLANLVVHLTVAVAKTEWVSQHTDFLPWVKTALLNFACVVFDARLRDDNTLYYFSVPIVVALAAAVWVLCRRTPRAVWLFVVTLIGGVGLGLVAADLVFGGFRFTVARYTMPCYLGVQLALAYVLATQLGAGPPRRYWWGGATATALAAGTLSCALFVRADTWWTKTFSRYNWEVAHVIESARHPLVITSSPGMALTLSYVVDAGVSTLVVDDGQVPIIPPQFINVFAFLPSAELRRIVESEGWDLTPALERGGLWRLIRRR